MRVFTWANLVLKATLTRFDSSIRHIHLTAKYDGLPCRFLVLFFIFWKKNRKEKIKSKNTKNEKQEVKNKHENMEKNQDEKQKNQRQKAEK